MTPGTVRGGDTGAMLFPVAMPRGASDFAYGRPEGDGSMHRLVTFTCAACGLMALLCMGGSREPTRLDSGWRFKLEDLPGAEQPAFDDHAWQELVIPHNWGWAEAQNGRPVGRHRGAFGALCFEITGHLSSGGSMCWRSAQAMLPNPTSHR